MCIMCTFTNKYITRYLSRSSSGREQEKGKGTEEEEFNEKIDRYEEKRKEKKDKRKNDAKVKGEEEGK